MEIKDYIRFLSKNYLMVLVITVLFAGIAYFISVTKPPTYQTSASLEVSRFEKKSQSEVSYFQYDNFYSYQTASAASDNLIGWIMSAATVAEIYEKAGYDVPDTSLKELAKTFTANKAIGTSAVVSISYSSPNKEESISMISTATDVLKDKIENYNSVSEQNVFSVQTSSPFTVVAPKMEGINTIIAAFVGLLLSIGVASIREAIRH